jgi:hypothetical protein
MALARCRDKVLHQSWEPNVFVYLDDIVICSETFEEHLEWANLTINTVKSKFCQREIKYLGYILSGNGLRLDPVKVSGILNYQAPTRIREVQQFMGIANFYSRFIENFAQISELLKGEKKNEKSSKKFVWTAEAENAFNQIKSKLISAPILANPDFGSDRAIGAVLTHVHARVEKVIYYIQNENVWQSYLRFVIFAVNRGCILLRLNELLGAYMVSEPKIRWFGSFVPWAMELQQYEMTIIHKKGWLNVVPDALSQSLDAIALNSSSLRHVRFLSPFAVPD